MTSISFDLETGRDFCQKCGVEKAKDCPCPLPDCGFWSHKTPRGMKCTGSAVVLRNGDRGCLRCNTKVNPGKPVKDKPGARIGITTPGMDRW